MRAIARPFSFALCRGAKQTTKPFVTAAAVDAWSDILPHGEPGMLRFRRSGAAPPNTLFKYQKPRYKSEIL
ncbi:hypothetical protein DXT90_11515 [Agrobacterium tumefaciens]|nr:hypothetical protein [Agrobacterium tumefaciens]